MDDTRKCSWLFIALYSHYSKQTLRHSVCYITLQHFFCFFLSLKLKSFTALGSTSTLAESGDTTLSSTPFCFGWILTGEDWESFTLVWDILSSWTGCKVCPPLELSPLDLEVSLPLLSFRINVSRIIVARFKMSSASLDNSPSGLKGLSLLSKLKWIKTDTRKYKYIKVGMHV